MLFTYKLFYKRYKGGGCIENCVGLLAKRPAKPLKQS